MNKTKKYLLVCLLAVFVSLLGATATMAASGTVAKIGSTKYSSLEAAFKAAKNKDTIVLQKDVSYSSVLSFSRSGKTVTLNLNKHTITFKKSSAYLYVKKGTLKIKNGTLKQAGSTYDADTGSTVSTVLRTAKNGTVQITSGSYKGELKNQGTMTISGGKFYNMYASTDEAGYEETVSVYGTLINNTGTMTIKAGTFTKKAKTWNAGSLVMNEGTMKISGGTFTTTGGYSLTNSNGSLTISGGTITATDTKGYMASGSGVVYNGGDDAKLVIKGGTLTAGDGVAAAVLNYSGKVTISKGKLVKEDSSGYTPSCVITNAGRVTIKGGTFKSVGNVIEAYAHGDESSDNYYGVVTISGGTFKTTGSKKVLLYAGNGGKITVKGGTFTGKKSYKYYQAPASEYSVKGKVTITVSDENFTTKYEEYTD